MHLGAPMRGLDSEVGRIFVFADDHAVRSRPAVARPGRLHGNADFSDPDAIAFLHPSNDLREQWSCLIAQLLFGGCHPAKFVTVTRHISLQNESKVALLGRALFSVKNRL